MNKVVSLDYCTLEFHDCYVVAVINEAVLFTQTLSDQVTKIILDNFKNSKFVYITNRIYSYKVHSDVYHHSSKVPSLAGLAVVSENPFSLDTAKIQGRFLDKPFKLFEKLDDAVFWAKAIVELYK